MASEHRGMLRWLMRPMRGPQDAVTAALKHPVDVPNTFTGTVKGQKPVQLDSTFNLFFTKAQQIYQNCHILLIQSIFGLSF
jgi:hypothetical protein